MTVLNPRQTAIQDEGVGLGFAHTLNFVGGAVVAALVGGVATVTVTGGGGSFGLTSVTITPPYGTRDIVVNIVDAGVGAGSKILFTDGHYSDLDVNDPSDIFASVVSVAVGSFNVRLQAKGPESIGGPFKFFYAIG